MLMSVGKDVAFNEWIQVRDHSGNLRGLEERERNMMVPNSSSKRGPGTNSRT